MKRSLALNCGLSMAGRPGHENGSGAYMACLAWQPCFTECAFVDCSHALSAPHLRHLPVLSCIPKEQHVSFVHSTAPQAARVLWYVGGASKAQCLQQQYQQQSRDSRNFGGKGALKTSCWCRSLNFRHISCIPACGADMCRRGGPRRLKHTSDMHPARTDEAQHSQEAFKKRMDAHNVQDLFWSLTAWCA